MKRLLISLLVAAHPAAAQSFGSRTHFTEAGGREIYSGICAGCHMADGRGAVGAGAYPALAQDARLADPAYPIAMVLHGAGAMPGFAATLSDRQVAEVVAYIRTHFGNAYARTPTEADVHAAR
ncbi:MAG: cytochrome c [Rhodospirillales bacterium]|nr:cytochrome c [Rhodospirillales bacterium]MDE2199669.1 cytochrome c [Rhodospirillales bacterium]MDE2574123.1 cytochrome c [Rhodospirillales bacterium]